MTKLSNTLLLLSFTLVAWSSATVTNQEPAPQNITDYDFMEKDSDTIINKLRTETTCNELDGQDKCEELYTDTKYDKRRQLDTNRDNVIRNMRGRYKDRDAIIDKSRRTETSCDELDGQDEDKRTCEKQYNGMYYHIGSGKKDCEELRVSLIENSYKLIEILENAGKLIDFHNPFYGNYMIFLTSCVPINPNPDLSPFLTNFDLNPVRTETEYKKRRKQDPDRDKVISNIRKQYSGDVCENLDIGFPYNCQDICSYIYRDKGDKKECEKLEVTLIEDLEEVYEALDEGDEDDFEDIDRELLDVYLNVGISGLDNIIKGYSIRKAEDFLLWLIEDYSNSDIFIKEDDDYKTLITLFEAIDSSYKKKTEIWTIFEERISRSYTLMELVIDSGSKELMSWFLSYINNVNPACYNDTKSAACFKVYCKIGNVLEDDEQGIWHEDFEDFQDYLNGIISEGTNGANWRPAKIRPETGADADDVENLDDLLKEQGSNDTWVDALCETLLT